MDDAASVDAISPLVVDNGKTASCSFSVYLDDCGGISVACLIFGNDRASFVFEGRSGFVEISGCGVIEVSVRVSEHKDE